MAAYLSLRHKETGVTYTDAGLVQVDEMLCAHLGVEPDPVNWFMGWMDWVGFSIAVSGKSVSDALAHHMDMDSPLGAPCADTLRLCQWFIDTFENASFSGR